MNFERSDNPLTTLDIGRISNPIKIASLYFSARKDIDNLDCSNYKDCVRILEWISKKELNHGWQDQYYVGVIIADEGRSGSASVINFELKPIREYIGYYLEFHGVKYFIPDPNNP